MNKPTLSEKINLILEYSKEYRGVLFIGLLFFISGVILIFCGLYFDTIFPIVFGGIWASVSLFALLYTMPSTISYYYEKALIKKYGRSSNASLVEKEIIDNSYYDSEEYFVATDSKGKLVTELNYLLTFSYKYKNETFENSEMIDKDQFEKLKIGDVIPIKFLSINPEKSSIRKIKLKKMTDYTNHLN